MCLHTFPRATPARARNPVMGQGKPENTINQHNTTTVDTGTLSSALSFLAVTFNMPSPSSSSKLALVMGVANQRSIAWSIVEALLRKDYHVVCTFRDERFQTAVEKLIGEKKREDSKTSSLHALPCNVSSEVPLLFQERLPELLHEQQHELPSTLDAIVHSIAYASASSMKQGTLLTTSREDFLEAHEISTYSFVETARESLPLMNGGSSSLTALSYLGGVRAVPNYNVMGPCKASLEACVRGLALELGGFQKGIRVNCVSAGPLNTLSARGIQSFTTMRQDCETRNMLKRNVTNEEVANVVSFLASTEASGVTGQTYYVDGGYNTTAGPAI
jgi:enoyl-[acyl-carrier protein] reductase I